MVTIEVECSRYWRGCCVLVRIICCYAMNCRRLLETETEMLFCFVSFSQELMQRL